MRRRAFKYLPFSATKSVKLRTKTKGVKATIVTKGTNPRLANITKVSATCGCSAQN